MDHREGRELGPYPLQERFCGGGMGGVYRGHHRMEEQPRAITMMSSGQGSHERVVQLFHRDDEEREPLPPILEAPDGLWAMVEPALAGHGPPRRGRTPRWPRTRSGSGRALAEASRTGRGRACDAVGRVGARCAAR